MFILPVVGLFVGATHKNGNRIIRPLRLHIHLQCGKLRARTWIPKGKNTAFISILYTSPIYPLVMLNPKSIVSVY
jgi:hypothetical protein